MWYYRSPNSSVSNDLKLTEYMTKVNSMILGDKLFVGDFNFPHVNWDDWTVNGDGSGTSGLFSGCLRE